MSGAQPSGLDWTDKTIPSFSLGLLNCDYKLYSSPVPLMVMVLMEQEHHHHTVSPVVVDGAGMDMGLSLSHISVPQMLCFISAEISCWVKHIIGGGRCVDCGGASRK